MNLLYRRRALLWAALAAGLICLATGCGEPVDTPDAGPFEAAIATYLDQGNMALVVKQIKEGPTVSGNSATLKASLTRATVGGPSVTWTFHFEQTPDGNWKAVGHEQ